MKNEKIIQKKCYNCANLDKSRKKVHEPTALVPFPQWIYGCTGGGRQWHIGWIYNDNQLKKQGCSNWCNEKLVKQNQSIS